MPDFWKGWLSTFWTVNRIHVLWVPPVCRSCSRRLKKWCRPRHPRFFQAPPKKAENSRKARRLSSGWTAISCRNKFWTAQWAACTPYIRCEAAMCLILSKRSADCTGDGRGKALSAGYRQCVQWGNYTYACTGGSRYAEWNHPLSHAVILLFSQGRIRHFS